MSRTVLVVAGEASGDAWGAGLVAAARRLDPDVRFVGMGGDAMRAAGVEIAVDAARLAVVGLWEVLARLPQVLAARRRLRALLAERRPRAVLLIDYPDFNLRFARDARRAGAAVHYFVSPQVWAWRPGRVAVIARRVDRMMVLFAFEEEIYRRAGVPVAYVGHPLAESEPPLSPAAEARARLGLAGDGRVLALLPGSRSGEVARLLPLQLAAAARLAQGRDGLVALVPEAPSLPRDLVSRIVAGSAMPRARIVRGAFADVLDAADAAIVASGTATLQAGLRCTPMAVVYRIHPISAWLGRRLLLVRDIALVNLVAGRRIVPELLQEACTPERIALEIAPLLDDRERRAAMRRDLEEVRAKLGPPGAFDRAARLLLEGLASGAS